MKKQAAAAPAKKASKTKPRASPKKAAGKAKGTRRSGAHPAATALHKAALAYPQTVVDHPWGETAFKVAGKKVFCFFGENADGGFGCSLKLPYRADEALKHKFAQRTGYGLGNSGWVSLTFKKSDKPDIAMLLDWLDESWRAIAPKKLSAGFAPPKQK